MENDFIELDSPAPGMGHNAPPLEELLVEEFAPQLRRKDELLAARERAPAVVADEETAKRVADLIRLFGACIGAAKQQHKLRKEPFLQGGRLVDAILHRVTDPLDTGKTDLERRLTAYQRQKAEAERQRREAEAERQRQEAERLRRETEARLERATTEDDIDAAISTEAEAQQATADAIEATKAATAPVTDLSRTRGEFGSVASLRSFWDFADLDRAAIDLETLRPYLPLAALESAVRGFIKAGGRELKGVRIFQNSKTAVR